MKDIGKKYVEVINYSSAFSQAWLRKPQNLPSSFFHVTGLRSSRDLDENTIKSFQETYLLDAASPSTWIQTGAIVLPGAPKAAVTDVSKSGRYSISLYNNGVGTAGVKKDAGSFIEVIDQQGNSYRLDTTATHGKVIGDSWFGGGCSWSSDERFVAYVAQVAGSSVTSSTRKTVIEELATTTPTEGKETPNKFDYIEDWGEKYVDVSDLGIFVLDIQERKVIAILHDTQEYTIGQPVFVKHPTSASKYAIAYTAWDVKPRRLGMIYCFQRKASVWIADVTNALINSAEATSTDVLPHWKLSTGIKVARSARSSPSGNHLIFLGNRKGFDSHNGCSELFKVDLLSFWQNPDAEVNPVTVINEVRRSSDNAKAFPGLFLESLPKNCFVNESDILLVSLWESRDALLRVSLNHTSPEALQDIVWWKDLPTDWKDSSIQILDIHNEAGIYVLAQVSSPSLPPQLILLTIDGGDQVSHALLGPSPRSVGITSKYLPAPLGSVPSAQVGWSVFRHETDGIPFNSILLYPKTVNPTTPLPLIVVPHGGPHSCLSNSYVGSYIFLLQATNAAVLYVNYRGSTGFGQDSIESLLGKIGTNDVADIMTSLNHVLSLTWSESEGFQSNQGGAGNAFLDANRVGIVGGSHGGFLSAHMSGQYPDVFKVCALRNPVTNIPAMASVTDIPDWCHVEAQSGSVDLTRGAITDQELIAMRKASPIAHIDRYRAPTLVCLGAKDRRVPVSQGVEFYHLLQVRNIPSRLMIFPEDVHAIDSPTTEAEHWIAIAQWIGKYL